MAEAITDKLVVRMKEIVAKHLGCDESKITMNASFMHDLGADSLDHLELSCDFEEAFDVEIGDLEVDRIETFGDAVMLVQELVAMA